MQKSMQKSIGAFGGHLFLRAAIASALAFIVYMSVAFVFTSIGTEKIGYTVYKEENGQLVNIGNYYYDDLDALESEAKLEQEIHDGESVDEQTGETVIYRTQSIRSDMAPWMKVASFLIAEICMIGIYTSMLYITAWEEGNHDYNHVRYDNGNEDLWRGLKAGLIASIPCAAAWVILLISRLTGMFATFGGTVKLFFVPYFPIVTAALPTTRSADALWWALPVLLLLAAVKPLTCHWAYRMGYADKTLKAIILYKGDEKAARQKTNKR